MINVLVVDDSAVMRRVLSEELSGFSDIKVVGTATDPYVARDKIIRLDPDVITLDLQMPKMDGLTFLMKLMKYHPLPVVIVSGKAVENGKEAIRALELGAVEVISKPKQEKDTLFFSRRLATAVRAAAKARVRKRKAKEAPKTGAKPISMPVRLPVHKVIAIGASTGGTEALATILTRMPDNSPPILVVQHMPECFTRTFAERLDQMCTISVCEAEDNTALAAGVAYIAPGGRHMLLTKRNGQYYLKIKNGPRVHHQYPSVNVLFQSVARCAGSNSIGVLLTGMGEDGAKGLLMMHEQGAYTIAQDEKTSVVFGMPRVAIELNAAQSVIALPHIAQRIISVLSDQNHKKPVDKMMKKDSNTQRRHL